MTAGLSCIGGLLTASAAATAIAAPAAGATGLTIHQVPGGGHVSPFAGQTVTAVPGEVTNVFSSGFYMQDPHPVGGPFKQAIEVAFAVAADNGAGAGLRPPAGGLADFGPHVVNSRRLRRPDQRPRPAAGLHQPGTLDLAA